MKIKVADFGEFDMPDKFTFREMNFIKKMTGLRAGELYPALNAGDSDVFVAFALTAIRRAHSDLDEDQILDLEIGTIEMIVEDADREAVKAADPPVGGLPERSDNGTPPEPTVSTTETLVTSG